MAKNSVSQWDTNEASNTDVGGNNIAENCSPGGINDALREIMAQIATLDPPGSADTETISGDWTLSGALTLDASSLSGTAFLDEDNMASDSATKLASQQSIKAYVDARAAINVQTFTATGTYTPTSGAKYALVEVQGGGASGGGAKASSASEAASGGGGGAGGYARKMIDISGLTGNPSITIGAAGASVSGDNAGNNGGDSVYDDTGVGGSDTLTGSGGVGGLRIADVGGANVVSGGLGGAATGGELNAGGEGGGSGVAHGARNYASGGKGASSFFGGGGRETANAAGADGVAPGAGGSGASTQNSQSGTASGAGVAGIVVITEYF